MKRTADQVVVGKLQSMNDGVCIGRKTVVIVWIVPWKKETKWMKHKICRTIESV